MMCECGCGREVKRGNRFMNGHNWRGRKHSKEACEKIRRGNLGKKLSKETIEKQRQAKLGKEVSEETCEKQRQAKLGKKNPNFGKEFSKETKKNMRLAAIKRIEKNIRSGGQITPSYNLGACKLIDEYGKLHGYNFQHAENGGEFDIKELGYWIDGYDKEKNVVIEVDELHHFDPDGNLSEKDAERQKEIENFLRCKFIRIKV